MRSVTVIIREERLVLKFDELSKSAQDRAIRQVVKKYELGHFLSEKALDDYRSKDKSLAKVKDQIYVLVKKALDTVAEKDLEFFDTGQIFTEDALTLTKPL